MAVYKLEWVNASLLPRLGETLEKDSTYLLRMSALHSLRLLSGCVPLELTDQKILPLLVKASKDSQANVRLVLVGTIADIGKLALPESSLNLIKRFFS